MIMISFQWDVSNPTLLKAFFKIKQNHLQRFRNQINNKGELSVGMEVQVGSKLFGAYTK